MIKVTIYKTERQEYAGFDMEGHAGYAEAGEDIVCAGVSALVINALNSIERFTDDEKAAFRMKIPEVLSSVLTEYHHMMPHYCWIP